jgi:arabinofuranan 3-O-arabinosyltransferase
MPSPADGRALLQVKAFLMSPRVGSVLWLLGLLGLAGRIVIASRSEGADLLQVWSAVHDFLHHLPPYRPRPSVLPFNYPPSALLLLAPLGLAKFASVKAAFAVINALAVAVAAWLCLGLFDIPWRSAAGGALLVAVCLFSPVIETLDTGNINGLVLAGEAGALLAASRHRWLTAGALLGLSFAIKPVLLPLLLVFALWRRWAAAALALAIPVTLSAIAFSLATGAGQYLTDTVPALAAGPSGGQSENVALRGAVFLMGMPPELGTGLRLLLLLVAGGVTWRCWRAPNDRAIEMVEVAGLILITTFLGHSFAWPHYAVYLLPLLVSVVHPASPMRTWIAAAGVYAIGAPDLRLWLSAGAAGSVLVHLRFTVGFILLFIVVATALWRATRPGQPGDPAGR